MPFELQLCPATASTDGSNYWREYGIAPVAYMYRYRRRLLALSCCDYTTVRVQLYGRTGAGAAAWFDALTVSPGVPLTSSTSTTAVDPTYEYNVTGVRILAPTQSCITDAANAGSWCMRVKVCLEYQAGSNSNWAEIQLA